jgi:hypothetical protein
MGTKVVAVFVLVALAALVFASVAQAGSGGTTEAIIKDAADNNAIDGNWSAAQVRAALAELRNNPIYLQYTDYEGVLEDYLASLPSPGAQAAGAGQSLKFTGGEILLLFGAGVSLMGSGLALRRRRS